MSLSKLDVTNWHSYPSFFSTAVLVNINFKNGEYYGDVIISIRDKIGMLFNVYFRVLYNFCCLYRKTGHTLLICQPHPPHTTLNHCMVRAILKLCMCEFCIVHVHNGVLQPVDTIEDE